MNNKRVANSSDRILGVQKNRLCLKVQVRDRNLHQLLILQITINLFCILWKQTLSCFYDLFQQISITTKFSWLQMNSILLEYYLKFEIQYLLPKDRQWQHKHSLHWPPFTSRQLILRKYTLIYYKNGFCATYPKLKMINLEWLQSPKILEFPSK